MLDWSDAGNRLLRKWETERNCADKPAINIDRRSGHSTKHSGPFNVWARKSGNDCRLSRIRKTRQYTQHLDPKLFRRCPGKDSPTDAFHAWFNLFDRHK